MFLVEENAHLFILIRNSGPVLYKKIISTKFQVWSNDLPENCHWGFSESKIWWKIHIIFFVVLGGIVLGFYLFFFFFVGFLVFFFQIGYLAQKLRLTITQDLPGASVLTASSGCSDIISLQLLFTLQLFFSCRQIFHMSCTEVLIDRELSC